MMTAEEVIGKIHASRETGRKSGLSNTAELMTFLNCEPSVPVIHVAGTNGKGSICAVTECVLRHAGYRTGLYTSPFLQVYNERIRIDGRPVDDSELAEAGTELFEAVEKLNAEREHWFTPFELGTALAFLIFRRQKVTVAVIEVGLGGRFDATNAMNRVTVSAIGAIGMDHMQFLGNTLPEIAFEKAGIMKPGTPVVCHPANREVADVFCDIAGQKGAILRQTTTDMIRNAVCTAYASQADFRVGRLWIPRLMISLPGRHQLTNVLTALGLIGELAEKGLKISIPAIRAGCADVFWPARLEWAEPGFLIDGAHNVQGITALTGFVKEHLAGRRRILLLGVLAEKVTDEMLDMICSMGECAVTVTPDYASRALSAEKLAEMLNTRGLPATAAGTIEEGVAEARRLAGEDAVIIACGSLYFVGGLRTVLGLRP